MAILAKVREEEVFAEVLNEFVSCRGTAKFPEHLRARNQMMQPTAPQRFYMSILIRPVSQTTVFECSRIKAHRRVFSCARFAPVRFEQLGRFGQDESGLAIAQPFNANSLYAARNRLQIAVYISLDAKTIREN
jgi:hypothetical protein